MKSFRQACQAKAQDHDLNHGVKQTDPSQFRFCMCCHVRTATIMYGIWNLILHAFFFVLLVIVLNHPNMLNNQDTDSNDIKISSSSDMLVSDTNHKTVSVFEEKSGEDYYTLYIRKRKWGIEDAKLAVFITMCSFLLSFMLVYGAIKGRPIYLMPSFCFQVLDLGISFVTFASYLSYMPDVSYIIVDNQNFPFRQELLQMNSHCLSLVIVLLFVLSLGIKVYIVNMVWTCYKYLVMKECRRSAITSYIINDSESLMPPDYDTATKLPEYHAAFQTPPPPYPAQEGENDPPPPPPPQIQATQ